ncbi:MAG: alanine racemase [Aquabacterium sp.]|uniref:alanine racemase n=1 Tax=Aquabacterium sp. TaxID=1872578 RepID=UPI00271EB104|nr:alanine racemase [Aquabacterium sp.]MDO9004952.1 alanine racemase [Aquabacterium sp.]
MSRPIQARIDLSALKSNLRVVRRLATSRIMAVIKANAYGHGLLRAAEALDEAEGFALLDVRDAIALREAGFRQTILLLEGFFTADELPLLAEYELSTVIHSTQQLAMLDAYPRRGSLSVWLKINTGMNRLGFAPEQLPAVMEKLKSHPAIGEVTLMTHFAHADEAEGVAEQLERFKGLTAAYRAPRSLANSAAVLRYPATHAEWVRPGIMLYGASPFADTSAQQLGLQPVMTLSSEIISVRELKAGDRVGYAGLFRADKCMRIGTVACGYADGYPRQSGRVEPEAPGTHRPTPGGYAPTGTPVLVNGQRTSTLGRVSMDMLSVDLSEVSGAEVGSPVTLWGNGMPVEEVAAAAGTISYELMCALTARVPVEY